MKHTSFLRKLVVALLSCTLCCTGMTVPAFSADNTGELPERFDWREEAPEILTPVKDQIGGTCWAYSTLSCIESNMIRKGMADSSIDLSETHLVWFTDGQGSPTDPADTRYGGGLEYGVKGYNAGAYVTVILASLAAWQGVAYESDFPSLSEHSVLDESLRYQSAAHLQNAQYYAYTVKQIPFTIQRLTERGPIKLDYCHDYDHPLSEKSGYYNPDYVSVTKANGGTHGVVLVGWDDRYAKENFTKEPPGDGAWIIRNSWGNYENSEDGYFYMSYYEPSISMLTSYDCEPVTNYGSVHSYNCTYIKAKPLPSSEYGYYTANVFEAPKAEKIAAVGFMLSMPRSVQTQYELSVYLLNQAPAGPQDGTLVCQTEGTADLSGFYTVKLPESIAVEKGQKYSVVMKTSAGTMCFFDDAGYKEGVSYYAYHTAGQTEPIAWTDCFGTDFGDACIQVYTEYEGETEQFIRGDVNRDGIVNAVDLSLLKQVLLGNERTDIDRKAADWNSDGTISAEDARGLRDFLLMASDQDDLKIRLTGSTADKRDEAFRRQLQDAVTARVPDFDFSQFTFETHGMTYLHAKNDATEEIGKQFYFWVYYQDYLLDPEHYEMHVRQCYDGTFETDAEFLTADMQEKLAEAVEAPRIAEADAVSAAREYAAAQVLPDLPSVIYQPSERFGEKPKLLVFSLEEGRLAYQITDPQCNRYELGTGQSKILCEVAAVVYVDAVTGDVLENRFTVIKSVSGF